MDFQDDRREEVINYVVSKYGQDHVAQIITFGTMGARASIRDVGRALGMPYSEVDLEQLIKLCIRIKRNVPKWIRIDRLTRDIPSTSMEAGYEKKTNLRQIVQERMHQNNYDCRCLRCKEVRNQTENIGNAKLAVTRYRSSYGDEFFITYENCSFNEASSKRRCCYKN